MTLLEINLTDVLSETDPDDRVIVWAPAFREGPAGQLVGPRRKSIPLVDGVGSDEVVPGPLMVQVQCKAMSDTRPREVVVPEEGPVTLTALLQQTFTYTPAVVNESLTQITTARDDALAAVDGAVDQALAGSQHYSGTGFPQGVVTAPVGSTYTDTAATAGAVRWIKASGTGNTGWQVEYGDTGWRTITGAMFSEGELLIRRVNQAVYVTAGTGAYRTFKLSGASPAREILLPSGFRTNTREFVSIRLDAGKAEAGVFELAFDGGVQARMHPVFSDPGVNLQAQNSTYLTPAAWPPTLPGIPA